MAESIDLQYIFSCTFIHADREARQVAAQEADSIYGGFLAPILNGFSNSEIMSLDAQDDKWIGVMSPFLLKSNLTYDGGFNSTYTHWDNCEFLL